MRRVKLCKQWSSCPFCLDARAGYTLHSVAYWEMKERLKNERSDTMPISKPSGTELNQGVPLGARTTNEWILYPTLMEYLTDTSYEGGASRRTSTITLFFDSGTFKGSINDRDNDRSAFVTAESIEGFLAVLEAKLQSSSIEWRANQWKPQGKKK